MNIFRSLIGKVWNPNAAEVVKINTGQLYLIRPGNIRSSRECIYNEAMVTIRRVPSVEHNFQLVATRVYEDGDQALIEDEDESMSPPQTPKRPGMTVPQADEERAFLVSEELEFRTTTNADGDQTLVWRDLDGDIDEFYEFVATDMNAPTGAFFESCMYRAMYERKYKKSADSVDDADLEEFVWQPPAKKTKKKTARKGLAKEDKDTLGISSAMGSLTVDAASPMKGVKPTTKGKEVAGGPSVGEISELLSKPAEFYKWNKTNAEFDHVANVTASIVQQTSGDFDYWLLGTTVDEQLFAHRISAEMNQRWSNKMLSLTWNHMGDDGEQNSWLFRFEESADYDVFLYTFTRSMWEGLHHISWDKAKADEQAYVLSSNTEDVEMQDVEEEVEDEDDEEAIASELDPEEEQEDLSSDEDDDDLAPLLVPGERNSQLAVGYRGDRSYVVRGNNIGVFNHAAGNQVKYYATISKIATTKGKEFKPKEVMLHDQDTKMVLMNPSDPNSLYNMDIERGKVVEEWKVHDDITVDHIAPDTKFAQTTQQQTLVGISHNALFRVDPRKSGNKMVESQYKQYAGKNQFSGVSTTQTGQLAVASDKGDIRLFDSIGKNAKTALPPIGDPILGIDTTADGRWIVATTKTYLLLIDTLIGEGRYQGQLGFDRSFPANAKPMPKRLQLRGEHVAYMNHDISFTPAKFNHGEGQDETAIVTSTGHYVVAWDFGKVKRGLLDKYEIKKYEDLVVQDSFKFGDDKEIVVALSNNVLAINKKNLKRPTRTSLAPVSGRQSHSDIVNSPF